MKLFYRKNGQGAPLFILHGLFGLSDNWLGIAKQFRDHTVILPDLRNHGQSPHEDEWDYQVMAQDIAGLIDQLGYSQVSILGHSMGGKVAMTVADEYWSKVSKLVVADIGPRYYPVHHRTILEGLTSIDLKKLTSRQEADRHLARFVPDRMTRQFLLKNLYRTSNHQFRWRFNLPVIDRQIENVGQATFPNGAIDIPVLFVRGVNSDYVNDEDIPDIREFFTDNRVETIGNAGHWIHTDQPEAFVKTVRDFLVD